MVSPRNWQEESTRIELALRDFHLVAVNSRLYSDDHPEFRRAVASATRNWNDLLRDLKTVEIKRIGSDLTYKDTPLPGSIATTAEFRLSLEERDIECLVFEPGLTRQEVLAFAHFMRLTEENRRKVGEPGDYLRSRGVRHIQIWGLSEMGRTKEEEASAFSDVSPIAARDLRKFRNEALKNIDGLYQQAQVAGDLDVDVARNIVDQFLKDSIAHSSLLLGLSAIRSHDAYTSTHSLNVCFLAISMGRFLALDEAFMPQLGISCLLHDIGKMFVPTEILNKPGALTPQEWKIMEHHTTYGARFLLSVPHLSDLAPLVAYEHHMNPEGTGYPRPTRPYRVNFVSYIAAIADYYDALTTTRPYKPSLPPWEVVETLEKMTGLKTEPRVRQIFLAMVGKYPIGTLLELDTKQIAVVTSQNPLDAQRPRTRIVFDAQGQRLAQGPIVQLDETDDGGNPLRSVLRPLDPEEMGVDPLAILQEMLKTESSGHPPNTVHL